MMSHEEQLQEKAVTISRLRFNLSLWQIISLGGCVATVVISFFHYDNSNKEAYATKKDAIELSAKVDKLSGSMATLTNVIANNHVRDSANAIEIKQTVILNKRMTDFQLAYIKKQCERLGFVTEKWDKAHSKLTFTGN